MNRTYRQGQERLAQERATVGIVAKQVTLSRDIPGHLR
jgi:hypothetical protein